MTSVKNPVFILLMLLLISLNDRAESLFCGENQIQCENYSRCIPIRYICDGGHDCRDGSDESFCDTFSRNGFGGCGLLEARCNENYACLPLKEFCMRSHDQCPDRVDHRICQMIKNGRIQRLENVVLPTTPKPTQPTLPPVVEPNLLKSETQGEMFEGTFNVTLSHRDCPNLYTRIGEHCFSLLYIIKTGWGEARAFCEVIDGQLVSFADDAQDFISLATHLRNFDLTADFWIGGRYVNDTDGWKWLTGSAMNLGSPFWAVRYNNLCLQREGVISAPYWLNKTACYHYAQAPKPQTNDMCAAITYKHYYYITDEDCLAEKSPLCIYKGNFNSSSSLLSLSAQ